MSCQENPQGQRGEAVPCPAEQTGRDATSPGGLPPPETQQGHIFSLLLVGFSMQPHGCCRFPNPPAQPHPDA